MPEPLDLENLAPEDLAPAARHHRALRAGPLPDGSLLSLPLLIAQGTAPGPTLALLAGVHGDEYEGIRAIPELLRELNLDRLRGRVLAVPICNVPAYWSATRCSPIDGHNLARVFPGNAEGTITERIAHVLTGQILARADFLIDLHSAGVQYSMPTMVGYHADDTPLGRASTAAAHAFGCEVLWGHPPDPTATGRTISAAIQLGIPWLYTEAPGAGRTRPEDVACFKQGVINVMRHLGMLPGEPVLQPVRRHLFGSGNLDRPVLAGASGYFIADVELLEEVEAGQPLARILGAYGEVLEVLHAPRSGCVGMLRGLPMIHAGDGAALVTGQLEVPGS